MRARALVTMVLILGAGGRAVARDASGPASGKAFEPFADVWTHVSPTSAVVYWQNGAEARHVEAAGKGYVEYGPTGDYGKKTPEFSLPPVCKEVSDKVRVFQEPCWSQLHRLTGLPGGRPCHFRPVYVSPDGRTIKGKDSVLTLRPHAEAISLPGELRGPPYVLDRAGATYLLRSDLDADGTAIEIAADNVTLDLDGHTIAYGRKALDNVYGMTARRRTGVKIVNGVIEEGPGAGRRRYPVLLRGCRKVEVAGLSVTYHGKDGQGILFSWQGAGSNVHHNLIYDKGTTTTSRHQQIAGIHFSPAIGSGGSRAHHNIILRARQTGIQFGASESAARQGKPQTEDVEICNNMVYLGSCMTNSMGVSVAGAVKGFGLRNNRIYGRGEMPECVFVGTGASYGKVSRNYTYSRSTGKVSKEYGSSSSLSSALRLCWGPHHVEVFENTFITTSGLTDGFRGNARNVWAACADPRQVEWRTSGEIDIHDNEIVALTEAPGEVYARAITVCGHHEASSRGLRFRNNRVTTNANCVVLSESYGCGSSDVVFLGNTFVKADAPGAFQWLRCGYWDKPTTGSAFIDCRFAGGASLDDVVFDGTRTRDFSVGWTLTVETQAGAAVAITDKAGKEVFRGKADASGLCRAHLMQYRQTPEGKTPLTPHVVKVTYGSKSATRTVTVRQACRIEVRPGE